jgi:hypothetical protein
VVEAEGIVVREGKELTVLRGWCGVVWCGVESVDDGKVKD